jgi:hypothetical protein
MDLTPERKIIVKGLRHPRAVTRIVRAELEKWWSIQDESGPLPPFTALVEKTNRQVYVELEINESLVTWFGSGSDRGVSRAVRRALNRLHPKPGSGVAVMLSPPLSPVPARAT